MQTGSQYIDGKYHFFKTSGEWVSPSSIDQKVLSVVRKKYPMARTNGSCTISGDEAIVQVTRPQGEGAMLMEVHVNLNTGYCTCDYYVWLDWFNKIPRTFYI